MACECPDSRFFADLADLNREFLGLLTSCVVDVRRPVLGMDPVWINMLCGLGEKELRFISETPCLLAGFAPPGSRAGDDARTSGHDDAGWHAALTLYSVALLSFLRATLGRDPLRASLCVGPEPVDICRVADISLGGLGGYAAQASGNLQARLVDVPTFWPDLIRAARSGNTEFRHLSRISAIPLVVSTAGQPHKRGI